MLSKEFCCVSCFLEIPDVDCIDFAGFRNDIPSLLILECFLLSLVLFLYQNGTGIAVITFIYTLQYIEVTPISLDYLINWFNSFRLSSLIIRLKYYVQAILASNVNILAYYETLIIEHYWSNRILRISFCTFPINTAWRLLVAALCFHDCS